MQGPPIIDAPKAVISEELVAGDGKKELGVLDEEIVREEEKDRDMRQKIEDEPQKQREIERQREIDRRRELDKKREDNIKRREDERVARYFATRPAPEAAPESQKVVIDGEYPPEFYAKPEDRYPSMPVVGDDFTFDHEELDEPVMNVPHMIHRSAIPLVEEELVGDNTEIYDDDLEFTFEFPLMPLEDLLVPEIPVSEVSVLNPAFGVTRPKITRQESPAIEEMEFPTPEAFIGRDDQFAKPKRMLVSLDRIREPRPDLAASRVRGFPVKLNGDSDLSDLHHFTRNYDIDPAFCREKFEQIIGEKVASGIARGEDRARRDAAEYFAKIGVINGDEETALHVALAKNNPVMTALILDNIVDNLDSAGKSKFLNRKNHEGESALDMAKSNPLIAQIFNDCGFEVAVKLDARDVAQEPWLYKQAKADKLSYGVSLDPAHHAGFGENLALKFYANRIRAIGEDAKVAAKPRIDYARMTDPVERAQSELWGSAPSSPKSHLESPRVSPGKVHVTQLARGLQGVGAVFKT